MKVIKYTFFDKPGEKANLKKLAKSCSNESTFTLAIQSTYDLDIVDASFISKKFYKIFHNE